MKFLRGGCEGRWVMKDEGVIGGVRERVQRTGRIHEGGGHSGDSFGGGDSAVGRQGSRSLLDSNPAGLGECRDGAAVGGYADLRQGGRGGVFVGTPGDATRTLSK